VRSLYVFALVGQAATPFSAAGHRIEFIEVEGVYAAVERIRRAPAVSEGALRAQHQVVAQIAERQAAVLPVRFGALVDAGELGGVVSQRREAIRDALALVRGRRQMTARLRAMDMASPTPVGPASHAAVTGTGYLESRRAAAAPPMPAAMAGFATAVRTWVVAARTEGSRGRVLATIYHLVEGADVEAYMAAAVQVQREMNDGVVTVSGPWAPFAFAPDVWP